MQIKAFIFDLDGVLVSTDEQHYRAWKRLAGEEGFPYSRKVNVLQRGVSRMESLEVMLEHAGVTCSENEKEEMAQRKNRYYQEMILEIGPQDLLEGVPGFLQGLRDQGIQLAVGSSSKNTAVILDRVEKAGYFDAVADGTQITHSKPDPEVFLLAARILGVEPKNCVVVEDADAGVEAALAAGMKVLAVGEAQGNLGAHVRAHSLAQITSKAAIEKFSSMKETA